MAVLTEANIVEIKKLLHDALMAEWKAQGHYESGKVVDEIDYQIEQTFGGVSIVGKMFAYGGYINEGVAASDIPFSPGSGAKKSKYIEALIGFVQRRMAVGTLQEARSVAFAIAHTQKREGMPTRGSYAFSGTGKRTEWVNEALNKNMDKIGGYIRQFYASYMRSKFQELIVTYSKEI
jgi:hypothetical protein